MFAKMECASVSMDSLVQLAPFLVASTIAATMVLVKEPQLKQHACATVVGLDSIVR